MSKYVEDSVLYMQAVLNSKYYESIPLSEKEPRPIIPWNQEKYE